MKDIFLPSQIVPVAVESIRPNAPLDFDLFMLAGRKQTPVLYREHHYPIEAADIRSLSENGIETLYIAQRDSAAYERYVREWVIPDRAIPAAERYKILRDISRASFLQALQSDCPAEMVQNAMRMGEEIVNAICDDDVVLVDLFSVMKHDYCTFMHATNVCAYCLALSTALGMTDRTALITIAVGALLHDIGKR